MTDQRYLVICPQVVGNMDDGFDIVYGCDNRDGYLTRREAIREGFKIRGSDDFNIAVVEEGRLVSLDWMDQEREQDDEELDACARQLGLSREAK